MEAAGPPGREGTCTVNPGCVRNQLTAPRHENLHIYNCMKWVTRQRPEIDRIACPWLILRFIDTEAEFLFVAEQEVMAVAAAQQAVPFDIAGAEYGHYEDRCTFDYFLEKHQLKEPALQKIAAIVRGADTHRHGLAPEAAGLWAIAAGMAYNQQNDQALLQQGLVIYDALYSWAIHLQHE